MVHLAKGSALDQLHLLELALTGVDDAFDLDVPLDIWS